MPRGLTRHRADGTAEIYTALDADGLLDTVIPHEVAHALLDSVLERPLPLWLNEGLAMSCEAERSLQARLRRYADVRAAGAGLGLVDIVHLDGYPETETELLSYYDGAAALTAFLIAAEGREEVLARAQRAASEELIVGIAGCPPAALEEPLLAWLARRREGRAGRRR